MLAKKGRRVLVTGATGLNDRLAGELGAAMPACPKATEYLAGLLEQIGVDEALMESLRP